MVEPAIHGEAMTPTQRALKDLRALAFMAQVVERWNPHAKVRQDLFGCIDIVAIGHGMIIGVQVCAGASHAARRKKMLDEPAMYRWLGCGGKLELWSYSKRGARGKRKTWQLRRESIRLADF